jgi:hypothetical protein
VVDLKTTDDASGRGFAKAFPSGGIGCRPASM